MNHHNGQHSVERHLVTGAAVLDEAHLGDIHGALGSVGREDVGPRQGWWHRLRTLLAILGPGLIVMVGDNDAGAFSTFAWLKGSVTSGPRIRICAAMRQRWQMPPLKSLPPLQLSNMHRLWMLVLRAYLLGAVLLVIVRIAQLALASGH